MLQLIKTRYTGVPVSVLVPLPGPPLHDSLSVQLTIRTFDPSGLGIRTSTDTEATWNLVRSVLGIDTLFCDSLSVQLGIRTGDTELEF